MPQLADFPFYAARLREGRPAPWTLSDLEEFAAAHPDDPFAGRVINRAAAKVALQIEATGEPPVWTALASRELEAWANVVANVWSRWGVERGETIAFFDYGSSPLVLLASSGYVPYLKHGAAERLGIGAICNDGVATMAPRMVTIIETIRPSALIIRRDLLVPFAAALDASSVTLMGRVRWIAVSEPEGAPTRNEIAQFAQRFAVPMYRLLRCDAAFLIAGECAGCGWFHLDSQYRATRLPSGDVAVTTRFASLCPAANYNLGRATLAAGGCPLEPSATRVIWD